MHDGVDDTFLNMANSSLKLSSRTCLTISFSEFCNLSRVIGTIFVFFVTAV